MKIPNDVALTNARFYNHTVLNDEKSRVANRPIYDEIEVCEVTHPGNKHTIGVFPAHEEYGYIDRNDEFGSIREKVTYAMQYSEQYLKFKSGDAQSQSGTPLSELTFLTEGRRLELKALKIYTAESLAALDGSNLKMLGQNGRDLKNKAIAYLAAAEKTSTMVGVKDELAKRDAEIVEMKAQIAQLSGNAPVEAAKPKASEFDTFDDADLINWIASSNPTHGFNESTPRETLIDAAEKILAREGKKKTV